MCGVASGYYIFDPVVRAAGEEYKRKKQEALEISQVVREPVESIWAQLAGKLPPPRFSSTPTRQSGDGAPGTAS